ncbi:LuxR C-terminal-related transcriptional regulator [Sinisalibacter aestuarii]|uniref:LuxR C-terminal-related transcriptional regulator n=1 Tax=Sinisalibacter aestuarii TaxID=2949426 RepID=UPI0024930EB2|nr:LuxR C-terminal-related transcriptional regulator [Sinisalibacter aestuarii]
MKSPLPAYVDAFASPDTGFDATLVKIIIDYKTGRFRQAMKRYHTLVGALGLDPEVPLLKQQDKLTEEIAPLLIIEGLVHLGYDATLAPDALWAYVDAISLFHPDDHVCHGAVYNVLLMLAFRRLDLGSAAEFAQLAINAYRLSGSEYLEGFIHLHLGFLHISSGELDAARGAVGAAEHCFALAGGPVCEDAMVTVVRWWIEAERTGRLPDAPALERVQDALVHGEFWPETFLVLATLQFRVAQAARDDAVLERHAALETVLRVRGMTELLPAMQLLRDEFFYRLPRGGLTGPAPLGLSERHMILLMPNSTSLRVNWGEDAGDVPLKLARLRVTQALLRGEQALQENRFDEAARQLLPTFELIESQGWTYLFTTARDTYETFCAECRSRSRFVDRARHIRDTYLGPLAAQERVDRSPPELTQAEYAILCLLPNATSNKALARTRGVSEATVKFHLKSIYAKLGVGRRRDAIEAAKRLGWIGQATSSGL